MSRFRRMVLFAMFDMPTETKGDLKRYRQFRKDLLSYGFIMFQYSVYVRFCDSLYMAEKYEAKIEEVAPEKSSIRVLRVTENQYKNMIIVENYREKPEEKVEEMTQLVMVF
ncbi:CRISPR-associated endonuclease Cas2 [Sulfurimonas lithotrophica]|uniref:CRISPR-associated endoribonuclease Cas2 n=1 Tax=Sulfurimonas lithotrophica TaxID=2590022 RepID=A0A5P8P3A8_9BACT|nr:CRISPR-associated endonuclease Cas2 [Sulfurimonas lithotrophica]QFR50165.1 CRISPR-associated endonuclease Cas2 [Sulfurimonas lithotrophica]